MIETILNEKYGYRTLKEIPEVSDYYQKEYFDKKLEGKDADREWLEKTLYLDIAIYLEENKCKRILDVGCGKGWLVDYLAYINFNAVGIDPGARRDEVREIFNRGIDDFDAPAFDAIVCLNVLEHIEKPEWFLQDVKRLLNEGGHFICQVPNDFSALQEATKKKPWWVVSPDHINYFDKNSLAALLIRNDFSVSNMSGDFPMELFLLMGIDYVGMPGQGKECHAMRVSFEKAIKPEDRRDIYAALSFLGHGRNIIAYSQIR